MGVRRIAFLIGIVSILYTALGVNMYIIQLQKGQSYRAQAAAITETNAATVPKRGGIYFTDKSGNSVPAAITKEYPSLFAVPKEIVKAAAQNKISIQEMAKQLSPFVGKDEAALVAILNKPNDPYEPLKNKISDDDLGAVSALNLPGIYVSYQPYRFYPLGNLAAHVLGFVSREKAIWSGQYGAEKYFNAELRGQTAAEAGVVTPGDDVALTIDYSIQAESEKILTDLVKNAKATGGSVLVQEPKTGKILAMASVPTFDPNNFSDSPVSSYLNPTVQAVYEPGSIIKVFTMAAGLDSGAVTPNTTFVDTGSLKLDGKTIKNWDLKAHGKVTMSNIIELSLNTGAAFVERQTGNETFYNYLVSYGLKEKTGIDLPGEVVGSLSPLENDVRPINYATASFGQGISMTPIRLMTMISALANDGVMMKPFINASQKPEIIRQIFSKDAADKTTVMMVNAVDKGGIAHIDGYTIAAKTGTAQYPDFKKGGYTKDVICTYGGFFPANDPKVAIVVKLDRPEGAPLAGTNVVPAFRELADFIINYYQIAPDNIQSLL